MNFFKAKFTKEGVQFGLLFASSNAINLLFLVRHYNEMNGPKNHNDKNQLPSPMRRLL